MKKVINGKVYDTSTARSIGYDSYGAMGDLNAWSETLYQKRTGEYFLFGQGGPMTKYSVSLGDNEWSGSDKIIPMSLAKAREWGEKHLHGEAYEAAFGLPDEDAEPVLLSMQLPAMLAAKARQKAVEDGVALTAIVERALTEYLM